MQPIVYVNPDRKLFTTKRASAHCVHKLDYHIVVSTKYRAPVLVGEVGSFVLDTIVKKCAELEAWLLGVAVQPEHIHILIGLKPTHSVAKVVKHIKGASSYLALKRYPELAEKIGGSKLWSGGYFATTVGKASVAQVIAYIQRQHEHHELPGD